MWTVQLIKMATKDISPNLHLITQRIKEGVNDEVLNK